MLAAARIVLRSTSTCLALALLACAPPEVGEIRNVVLISMDTTRPDYFGSYGFPHDTTPHLDALAADGTRFTRVIAPAPITLPSHSSMLTGMDPLRHGVRDNDGFRLGDSHVTLAEALAENGFRTGAVVGAFVLDARFGLDQGFRSYDDDFGAGHQGSASSYVERTATDAGRLALAFLEESRDERFFLFLHFFDPHSDYRPPGPFAARFGEGSYAGEIAYTDWAIGLVVDKLRELGLYDSTLILVAADHGESLGEHGEPSHAYFIYQATTRVPLIVRVPGLGGGRVVESTVGIVDVMPTILSLVGIPAPPEVQGRDLTPLLLGEGAPDVPLYVETFEPTKIGANPLRGLIAGRWKYIDGVKPELYDLDTDPKELHDLASEEPERARRLAALLEERLEESSPDADRIRLGDDERRRLEALGYLTGSTVDPATQIDPARPDARERIDLFTKLLIIRALVDARRLDDARRLCEEVLDEQPETASAYRYLGRVAIAQGKWQEAISHLRLYLALTPDPRDVIDAEGLQRPGTAPIDLETRTSVRGNLGIAYGALSRFEEAAGEFRRALALDPRDAGVRFNLGNALLGQGQEAEALAEYRRVLEIDPANRGARDRVAELERRLQAGDASR